MGQQGSRFKKKKRNSISAADNRASVSSFKEEYNFENPYMMTINETQIDRMQTQHHILRTIWGNNFSAPIKDKLSADHNYKVLDFGCGPGTFIFDLSSTYPLPTFIGVDFVPIFPTQVPRNTSFLVANIMDGLPFEDCTFDYIHARFLVMYFTQEEWENVVIKELSRVLKPGGYLECYDSEIPWYNMSPSLEKLSDAVQKELYARNIDPLMSRKIDEFIKATGEFEDIQKEQKDIPYGSWGGELSAQTFFQFFEGVRKPIKDIMNINDQGFDKLMKKFESEINYYHTYSKNHRIVARKIER
ncbi:8973_t:CDS:2 [Diversispora eburnea]|uniref:8973_t:CDS:1 n=1 Tax=Diversispora eburnea TaxID=1213867 RepID=A0A9N8ZE73_9GLOM|nr:8973_t:CDS:2 [Diversispora eburnea]